MIGAPLTDSVCISLRHELPGERVLEPAARALEPVVAQVLLHGGGGALGVVVLQPRDVLRAAQSLVISAPLRRHKNIGTHT